MILTLSWAAGEGFMRLRYKKIDPSCSRVRWSEFMEKERHGTI